MKLAINKISGNPYDTREDYGDLSGLRASIRKTNGLFQSLIVRPANGNRYELVFGGRRLQALKEEGHKTIDVEKREISNADMATLALCENVHRKDLNPVELARAYRRGLDATRLSTHAFAQMTGESDNKVTSYLQILELPDKILKNQKKYTTTQLITLGRLNKISSSARIMLENALGEREINSQFLRQIATSCESIQAAVLPDKTRRTLYGEVILHDYSNVPPQNFQDIKAYAGALLEVELTRYHEALRKTEKALIAKRKKGKQSVRLLPNPDRNLERVTERLRQTQLHVQRAHKQEYYPKASKRNQRKFKTAVNHLVSNLERIIEDG